MRRVLAVLSYLQATGSTCRKYKGLERIWMLYLVQSTFPVLLMVMGQCCHALPSYG